MITQKVNAVFGESKVLRGVIVQEGHPMEKFTRLAKLKDADLLLLGRKKSLKGSGIVSSKIARNSHCSLLIVPQRPSMNISRILIPIDFSGHSKLSLEAVEQIARQTGAKIECVHIYEVPSGYHTTGKSYEEFAEIMKGHAVHDFENFIREGNFDEVPHCTYLLHKRKKKCELINNLAHDIHSDMMVVGSRGRTSAAVVLMGSVAEKLTYLDNDIPLMIVKRKGENMDFLEAIMRI
ncbi:MAG: universal stress protein [Bacteroidetes bacterium]|nr:universal stress protein [Bacteroidota bacterium]MDA1121120.1 universal stress protein [Bacteroidota bacterium]